MNPVTKKDGSTPFCVDCHRLNSLTIKDAYPLPRTDDSLRLLGNQQWFSTIDLASGYWQVAMSTDAKRKAAFVTHEGLFQFRVVLFGLCNAPATFERLVDRVLSEGSTPVHRFYRLLSPFVRDFVGLSETLVALTRKRVPFVWTDRKQAAFEALKTCLISAPILGFPTADGLIILDTDASLFAVGGVLNQLQEYREVVIAFASRLSQ